MLIFASLFAKANRISSSNIYYQMNLYVSEWPMNSNM